MEINALFQPEFLQVQDFVRAAYVVLDANFLPEVLQSVVKIAREAGCKGTI